MLMVAPRGSVKEVTLLLTFPRSSTARIVTGKVMAEELVLKAVMSAGDIAFSQRRAFGLQLRQPLLQPRLVLGHVDNEAAVGAAATVCLWRTQLAVIDDRLLKHGGRRLGRVAGQCRASCKARRIPEQLWAGAKPQEACWIFAVYPHTRRV